MNLIYCHETGLCIFLGSCREYRFQTSNYAIVNHFSPTFSDSSYRSGPILTKIKSEHIQTMLAKMYGFHVYIQITNLMACCQNYSEAVSLQCLGILTPNFVRATLNTPHQLGHSATYWSQVIGN